MNPKDDPSTPGAAAGMRLPAHRAGRLATWPLRGCIAACVGLMTGCAPQVPLTAWSSPVPASSPLHSPNVTTGDVLEILYYPSARLQKAPYTLGVGDVVQVSVAGHPDLERERVNVMPDGTISLPQIGSVQVAGQSTDQAAQLIHQRYLQRKLNDPLVVLAVVEAQQRLKRLFEPSRMRSEGGMLVIPVFQGNPISLPFIEPVEVDRPLSEIRAEIALRYTREFDGQLSVVVNLRQREDANVLIMGEVKTPGKVVMKQPLTPLAAIASAGGYTDSADPQRVAVIRFSPEAGYQRWLFDLKNGMNEADSPHHGFTLARNDVVLVVKSGVADTNLWIAQYIRNNIPFSYFGITVNSNR
jgi:protein involved in polysaccharide export with SLBB domain